MKLSEAKRLIDELYSEHYQHETSDPEIVVDALGEYGHILRLTQK